MYTLAVFDLDGTLLDTLADLALAANLMLADLGLPALPQESYRHFIGHGPYVLVEGALAAAQKTVPGGPPAACTKEELEAAVQRFRGHYALHSLDNTRPYPGIAAMLEALGAAGVSAAVLSNKPDAAVKQLVEHFFPGLIHSSAGFIEGVPPKPDPAPLNRLVERHGRGRAACLYAGDMAVDLQTARNAGVFCAGVLWGFEGAFLAPDDNTALVETPAALERLILDGRP